MRLLLQAVAVAVALLLFAAVYLRAIDQTLDQYAPVPTPTHAHV